MLTMLRLEKIAHRTARRVDREGGLRCLRLLIELCLSAALLSRVSARQAQWLDQQLNLLVL